METSTMLQKEKIASQWVHLVLAQYHRWYQVYERPFTPQRVANQLNLLTDDIIVEGKSGVSHGKQEYVERLKLFEGWKNAHHVQSTSVQLHGDDNFSLHAEILYQNIRPNQERMSYKIHYEVLLTKTPSSLPLFKYVKIVPLETIENPLFEDAYISNRAISFMHYWCYCMEACHGNSAVFKELLSSKFQLQLSTYPTPIENWTQFDNWVQTVQNQVQESSHYPKNFKVKENSDGTISVTVTFDWKGTMLSGKSLTAETQHEWILENNPDERFCRMKSMKVARAH